MQLIVRRYSHYQRADGINIVGRWTGKYGAFGCHAKRNTKVVGCVEHLLNWDAYHKFSLPMSVPASLLDFSGGMTPFVSITDSSMLVPAESTQKERTHTYDHSFKFQLDRFHALHSLAICMNALPPTSSRTCTTGKGGTSCWKAIKKS